MTPIVEMVSESTLNDVMKYNLVVCWLDYRDPDIEKEFCFVGHWYQSVII